MLTGPALGAAIEAARQKKRVTKKELAEHFGVKPPSVQDWVRRGTIDKDKLVELWAYFADVVGPEHWGLPWHFTPVPPAPPAPAAASAVRDANEPRPIYGEPALAAALPVVLGRLPGLPDYTAGKVLNALQAAIRAQAPLEQIERDLLQWLNEPEQPGSTPGKQPGKQPGAA